MTTININLFYRRQKLFWRVTSLVAVLFVGYLYLFNSTVFNVVAREQTVKKLAVQQSEVVELEAQYLKLSGTVTMALAQELGFRDAASSAVFVNRDSAGGFVALNHL